MEDQQKINIMFLGSAGTITGSKYLIETRGSKNLIDCGFFQGTKDLRKKNREYLPVKAKIFNLQTLSAHADQIELLNWLNKIKNGSEKVFITHGEEKAACFLKIRIRDVFSGNCIIPELNSIEELSKL